VGYVDSLHRTGDRAVVEEAEVAVAVLDEHGVCLDDVHLAAEEVRQKPVLVPGVMPLQPSREALEEEIGDAGGEHLLGRRAVLVGNPLAGQKRALAVDHHAAAGLVDVCGLTEEAGIGHHLRLAAPGHDHHLDVGSVARLQRPGLQERERALGVAEQRAPLSEQGAVEVGVDAAQGHGAALR
jgi:hypothetical protein